MQQLMQYATNHPFLVAMAVAMVLAVLANEIRMRQTQFAAVGPQDVVRLMNQGAVVLDLRKPDEFAAGHIQGARNFSSDQILKAEETLKKYKQKAVVLVCDSGSLGSSAARELGRQGFATAVNLRGGLAAWRAENMPLAKGPAGKDGKSS
jgi:rhodanese-related sulfurtransferase